MCKPWTETVTSDMSAFSRGSESTYTNSMQECYESTNKLSGNTAEGLSETTSGADCKDDPTETTMNVVGMVSDLLLKNIEFQIKIKIGGKLLHFESTSLVRKDENSKASNQSWSEVVTSSNDNSKKRHRRPSYIKRLERRKTERDQNNSRSTNLSDTPCIIESTPISIMQRSVISDIDDSATSNTVKLVKKSSIQEQNPSETIKKIDNKYTCNIYEHLPAESSGNWADIVEKDHDNNAQQSAENEKPKEIISTFKEWVQKPTEETENEQPKEIVLTFKKWLREYLPEARSCWFYAHRPYESTIDEFRKYLVKNGKLEKYDDELEISTATAHHIIYNQEGFELATTLINDNLERYRLNIDKLLGKSYKIRDKDGEIVYSR